MTWWRIRDAALLWLAVLFGVPVLCYALWVTVGFFLGF